ncbi:MAG: hypothetical protein QOF80_2174 [Verrucomicrobiota bacterium]
MLLVATQSGGHHDDGRFEMHEDILYSHVTRHQRRLHLMTNPMPFEDSGGGINFYVKFHE